MYVYVYDVYEYDICVYIIYVYIYDVYDAYGYAYVHVYVYIEFFTKIIILTQTKAVHSSTHDACAEETGKIPRALWPTGLHWEI